MLVCIGRKFVVRLLTVIKRIEQRVFIPVQAELFLHAGDIGILDVRRIEPFQKDSTLSILL
jgi:hypothetical protein